MTINDLPVACIGDRVSCPKKGHSNCVIIQAASGPPVECGGKLIAREGDLCSCGARLVSKGQNIATHSSNSEPPHPIVVLYQERKAKEAAAAMAAASGAGTQGAADEDKEYDEQVRVLDENNVPLANVPYHITTEDGNVYKGLTDKQGCCERIHTDNPQNLTIYLGVPALEKW
jgi:hypothetical protein